MKTFTVVGLFIFCISILSLAQVDDRLITITDAPGAQHFPDVAYNSQDNTFLVVWEAVLEDDNGRVEIQGSIHKGDTGERIGSPIVILSDVGDLRAPEIAYNSVDNEFLVVARFEEQSLAIAQRVSANGQLIGNAVDIGTSNGPTFFDPSARARVVSVAHNAIDNKYFIALGGQPSAQILFANLDLDVPIPAFADGTNPAVSWSSASNVYLMVWEDREVRSTGSENISGQLFSNDGGFIGGIIHIRDQDFAEESPRVAYNGYDDEFLVVWDERIGFAPGNNTLTDTIGQIIKADGTLRGGSIPIENGSAYTLRQDIDFNYANESYLVVWKGDKSGEFSFADIWGGYMRSYYNYFSETFLIYDGGDDNTDEGNSEQYYDESKLPVVAAQTNSLFFLVVWEESGTNRNPSDSNILAKFVSVGTNNVDDWMVH